MIRIRNLHKFFNKGKQNEIHVINDVSLDLPERGMVAIFGKSGCGKTTLLNVIGGLDGFADGTLTIEDQSITEHTDVIRNRYIGYIFQNYNLNKEESCFDNVANALRLCGMTDEALIEERVMTALANVGMSQYRGRTPDTLSGGQQQRVAIARAIVKNPRIILADEPTGNLDEANTVMIMDLLKAIARDHLVLLVTHEANLVDYYCDTVIELSDGRVVSTKSNAAANGFAARDKNAIYLGELSKTELSDAHAAIEYYGDAPEEPIRLKIVNNSGKLYVQIDSERVQVLDTFSEVKLREGVYEEKPNQNAVSEGISMEKLPPVEGTHFGRLFSAWSSVKSGYVANFKNQKKGKKTLRRCMCLFASVIVFMSAVFGTSFGDIIDARNAYNHNVFYLYTPDGEVSAKLNAAVGDPNTGIDFISLTGRHPNGDDTVYFRTGSFETFHQVDYGSNFKTNAVYLDVSLAKDLELVVGKKEDLASNEILISTKVADALLEASTLGYITERRDLIGLISNMFSVDGKALRIAGVVRSGESAIYLTELAMAKYARMSTPSSLTSLASDFGTHVATGETVLAIRNERAGVKFPGIGETVQIHGRSVKVVDIKRAYTDYADWLEANGIKKLEQYDYFAELVKQQQPEFPGAVLDEVVATVSNTRYYEYYDYYYAELDAFLRDLYFFEPDSIELWMYLEKGVELAKWAYLPGDYYLAHAYAEQYGRYPTPDELSAVKDEFYYWDVDLKEQYYAYEEEFYRTPRPEGVYLNTYLLSDADYIATSKQIGNTHPSAMEGSGEGISYETEKVAVDPSAEALPDVYSFSRMQFTVIHSNDPDKTATWLEREFAGLEVPYGAFAALTTPDGIFEQILEENLKEIVASLITMGVVLVLMSVCMYFIMRSSLMNRIKEVGIYRAIGVSKKNLVFKFLIEAAVLTTLTVLIGYLLTSAFLFTVMGMTSIMEGIFYYPAWLAGAVLVTLYAVSLFFGILPILSLLRKTPSEILAKYDI
ncbi:MAG: ABC transporter ATP-binding protein/permease [Clostridia bacterium]|nr:ABC transporter ATP-binding protein/permease [Clostridia bacterium]